MFLGSGNAAGLELEFLLSYYFRIGANIQLPSDMGTMFKRLGVKPQSRSQLANLAGTLAWQ